MNENHECAAGGSDYPSDCELTQGLLERAHNRHQPLPRSEEWTRNLVRAKETKLLLLDVDGVMTDGTIIYTHDGHESKRFHTQDGFGLRILQEAGVEVGFITARQSEAVKRRAGDLNIKYLFQGAGSKLEIYDKILNQSQLRPLQTAYMGDDWLDLPVLNRAGLALAPANAVAEVKQAAHYVTSRTGGQGAVREACDLILEAKGLLATLLRNYSK